MSWADTEPLTMTRSDLTPNAALLLRRFQSGGVVDYVVWSLGDEPAESDHRAAVANTVDQFTAGWPWMAANQPERAVATRVDFRGFVGPCYHLSCGCLVLDIAHSGVSDYRRVCDSQPIHLPHL
jgi:hypothetical protein